MAGLSRSLVEVGISMVLKDGFSQQAGKISRSYLQMMNDMNDWNRAVQMQAGAAFDYGIQAIEKMTEAYTHYANISGELFMVGKIAGATAQEQKELLDVTRQVNLQTPLTNADIASGERYLAMAGNSAQAIKGMIGPAAELASVFQTNLGGKGGTADLMTNIMATFGIASRDAQKTADILYTATTSANINLTDLAQSLQYSGATFRNAGIDLATASAAIGVLGDQGIQASSAGTALANMIRYLTLSITGQKKKGADMLRAMGISNEDLVDAHGNLKDLGTLMGVLANRMQRLSGTARETAMYNIFGIRGQRASAALFQAIWNGSDKMQKIIDKANSSDGALHETMGQWLDTDQGSIAQLRASIDNLSVAIGKAEGGVFKPLINALTGIIKGLEWLSSSAPGKIAIVMTTAITFGATIVNGFRLLTGLLRMVMTYSTALTTSTAKGGAAMASMNGGARVMIAHLETMVALMAEYVALSYAGSGTFMALPGGGKLGKNVRGKPYVSFGGKSVSTATYAGTYAKGLGGKSPKPSSGGGGGSGASVASGALGLGSMAAMLAGGPWGIGIGLALGVGSLLVEALSSNTEAVQANTDRLSEQEVMAEYQAAYVKAMQNAAAAYKNQTSQSINLTINGQPIQANDGDSISLNEYGWY